jgi:2'-5' RNA ligase
VSRIGVAIAIPQPYASELRDYRESFGDEQARAVPTHITLVPPTDIDETIDLVTSHLTDVAKRHRAFHLRIRGTATFRPVSPVVFINVTEGISACELLAEDARQGPLAQDLAFPYHPHVTVAHDVAEEALDNAYEVLADYDRAFDVESFQLFVHDGVWRPVADYRLDTSEPT